MKQLITLNEWQERRLDELSVSAEDRPLITQLARDRRLQIDELRSGLRIKAYSWVGVIELNNLIIRIEPKLAGGTAGLVTMLTYIHGLERLKRYANQRSLQVDQALGLFDLLAHLFSESCESVMKRGILHDFALREEALPVLRGQLRIAEQVRTHFGRIDTLECRYDDHTSDIDENRLLALVLNICLAKVSNRKVRRSISRMQAVFARACNPAAIDLAATRRISWNRMNSRYEEAHRLAWLILDGLKIEDLLKVDTIRSFAFMLDMNSLFEAFVERLVADMVGERFSVKRQAVRNSAIWDEENNRSYKQIRPDLLLASAENRIVIDAKYKLYDVKGIDSADIYQAFLYGNAFDSDPVYLFYPSSGREIQTTPLSIRNWQNQSGATVIAVGLPLATLLDEIESDR